MNLSTLFDYTRQEINKAYQRTELEINKAYYTVFDSSLFAEGHIKNMTPSILVNIFLNLNRTEWQKQFEVCKDWKKLANDPASLLLFDKFLSEFKKENKNFFNDNFEKTFKYELQANENFLFSAIKNQVYFKFDNLKEPEIERLKNKNFYSKIVSDAGTLNLESIAKEYKNLGFSQDIIDDIERDQAAHSLNIPVLL